MTDQKERHGCLTAWLIVAIMANTLAALVYLWGDRMLPGQFQAAHRWFFPLVAIPCIFNIICAVALFRWKRWGFFGFAVTGISAPAFNLMLGISLAQILLGLAGLAILFGVLQLNHEGKKGWDRLE